MYRTKSSQSNLQTQINPTNTIEPNLEKPNLAELSQTKSIDAAPYLLKMNSFEGGGMFEVQIRLLSEAFRSLTFIILKEKL